MPPPNNRLALPARNAMLDPNALGQTVPAPYIPGTTPTPASRFVPGRELENLSIGIGRGITGQLEGTKQMLTDPVGTVRSILEAARQIGADPMTVLRMLQSARQQALSGGLGAGEMIGGMLPMPKLGNPMAARMAEPIDMTSRRAKQIFDEEDAFAKEMGAAQEASQHQRTIEKLLGHKDWLRKTDKQAEVIRRLNDIPGWKGTERLGTGYALNLWDDIANSAKQAFDNPERAYTSAELIRRHQAEIDDHFNQYISAIRERRKTLNPRSKYDREMIKEIDSVLGDVNVTPMQRD